MALRLVSRIGHTPFPLCLSLVYLLSLGVGQAPHSYDALATHIYRAFLGCAHSFSCQLAQTGLFVSACQRFEERDPGSTTYAWIHTYGAPALSVSHQARRQQ